MCIKYASLRKVFDFTFSFSYIIFWVLLKIVKARRVAKIDGVTKKFSSLD